MYICACVGFLNLFTFVFQPTSYKKENWLTDLYVVFSGISMHESRDILFVDRVRVHGTSFEVACSVFYIYIYFSCWISHVYKQLYFFFHHGYININSGFIAIVINIDMGLLDSILVLSSLSNLIWNSCKINQYSKCFCFFKLDHLLKTCCL